MDAPGYNRIPVCKTMFLDTLGISGRQIRTSLKKINSEGVLETEGHGGRPTALKEADRAIRKGIEDHINRFPKVESHYCRSSTKYQYLSSELNIARMYDMYKEEHPNGASKALYHIVFSKMHLKFHKPCKKRSMRDMHRLSHSNRRRKGSLRRSVSETHCREKHGQGSKRQMQVQFRR